MMMFVAIAIHVGWLASSMRCVEKNEIKEALKGPCTKGGGASTFRSVFGNGAVVQGAGNALTRIQVRH